MKNLTSLLSVGGVVCSSLGMVLTAIANKGQMKEAVAKEVAKALSK